MKKLDRTADKVFAVMIRISSIILSLIMIFVFFNVILRLTTKKPVLGSTEIVRYAALIGASLALCQNEWFDGNIRVTMILDILPKKVASAIAFIGYAVISGGIGMIVYFLLQQTIKYYNTGTLTNELFLPTCLFTGFLAFGFFTLMICFIIRTIIFGYRLFAKNPDYSIGTHRAPME